MDELYKQILTNNGLVGLAFFYLLVQGIALYYRFEKRMSEITEKLNDFVTVLIKVETILSNRRNSDDRNGTG